MAHSVLGFRFARRAICIGISTLLIACGGGDDGTGPAPTPPAASQPDGGDPPAREPAPPKHDPAPEPAPPERTPQPPVPDPEPPIEHADPHAALKVQAREYAQALWKASETLDPPGRALPSNRACLNPHGVASAYPWIFTGNVGQHIQNLTAARDLGFLPPEQAEQRVARLLTTIATLQQKAREKGARGGLLLGTTDSNTVNHHGDVGTIENAWLAASLALAKQAYPALAAQAGAILAQMRFDTLLHAGKQQFHISHNPATGKLSSTYDLMSETRLISYVAIALGNVPRSQYFHLDRVPEWAERKVDPSKYRVYEGVRVYEGTRSFGGFDFVPSWGGSVFETFSVPVLISEQKWGVNSWARSLPNMAKAHIKHGLDEFGYWGFSPATTPATNGYTEYGAPPMSVAGGYRPDGQRKETRTSGPVISLYSVLMLIEHEPEAVMAEMEKLLKNFPTLNHPTYGMMDSVAVQNGTVARCILHDNNAWALGAVTNFLTDGKLRGYVDKEWGHVLQPLLAIEAFSIPAKP